MLYLTREDSVELLPLTNRTSNCLRRAEIHTVGQLLDYPADAWLDIRNLGQKSADELTSLAARIRAGDGFQLAASKPKPPEPPPPPRLPEIPVEELGLSVRAYNCLERMGVRTAADLSEATLESLLAVENVGRKTAEQIMEKLNALREEFSFPGQEGAASGAPGEALYAVVKSLSAFTRLPQGDLLRYLAPCREASPGAEAAELLDLAFQQPPVRREALRAILRLLEPYEEGISAEELLKHLPDGTSSRTLKLLLGVLLRREQITIRNNRIRRRWPTALEFAERIADQRQRDILLSRLRGETLEEIGRRLDVTRERVRQLTQKALAGCSRLHEDQYQYLFNRYGFSREEFCLAFDEPEATYYYLEMVRPKGERKPIQELLADESIPVPLRRKAERAVYRQYVTIDGVRVLKDRQELVRYAVRTLCRDSTGMDEFFPRYQQLLESLGLEQDASLTIDSPSYIENRLQLCNYALWSQGRRFRYYPIDSQDFTALLEALDLTQYEDVEISSLKLFRDCPELMREYDVRDEYELHNLLKKIWPQDDSRVQFKRMPTIEIGTPDRNRQVLDLLRQYSPIANTDLAQRYEEAYGIKSLSALANYFACIDPYLHNGVYRIDQPPLPEEQQRRMAALLTGDFYPMPELRQLYRREFPDSDPGNLNPFVLKSLGFHPYEGYVVSARYSSATDYFRHLLTDGDVIDMTRSSHRYTDIKSYWSELAIRKSQREIVEFLPLQYLSLRRLQSAGVDAGDLADYCAAVCAFTRPGEYFTVASLRRKGFTHPLDDLGFEEWFYGSLLAEDPERFTYRRMGGTRLFFRGRKTVQLADFLGWLVEAEPSGRIDIYDLHETLERQYEISIPLHKLIEVAQSSELYYDPIMKAAYIDYDTYLEEI